MKDHSIHSLAITYTLISLLFVFLASCDSANQSPSDLNETFYFAADDGQSGLELWRSNGSSASTYRVKDINRLEQGSRPQQFVEINGVLYFVANDGLSGRELWKYVIASGETGLVKNISPRPNVAPDHLTVLGETLFFSADDGVNGRELWKSDGTAAGTMMISDLYAGLRASEPEDLVAAGGRLYFTAKTATTDRDLWVTDGTESGTLLLKDLQHVVDDNNFTRLTRISATASTSDQLFFILTNDLSGNELWVSSGEAAETQLLAQDKVDIFGPSQPSLTLAGGQIFFSLNQRSLWKTDGSVAGTVLVKQTPVLYPSALGDRLMFFSRGSGGNELWLSNGTEAGTLLVRQVSSTPHFFSTATVNDQLYFLMSSFSGIQGVDLWRSDGTDAGTVRIRTIMQENASLLHNGLQAFGNNVIFKINDQNMHQSLWISDGSEQGTRTIATIQSDVETDQNPALLFGAPFPFTPPDWQDVIALDNHLYFSADDSSSGFELWSSDGTLAGSVQAANINLATRSAFADDALTERGAYVGDTYYFTANDGVHGVELWRTDGTQQGTALVRDIFSGFSSSNPRSLSVMNGALFFFASESTVDGLYLWRSDGTESGTVKLRKVSNLNFSLFRGLTAFNNHLYFEEHQNETGQELWKTDGTLTGTQLLKDLFSGNASSDPANLTVYADRLIFSARDSYDDVSLWSSDGSAAGTVRLKTFQTIDSITSINGMLNLIADDGSGPGLWKSDGTEQGTLKYYTFADEEAGSQFVGHNDEFTFILQNPSFNNLFTLGQNKLWASNGSATATSLIKDVSLDFDREPARWLLATGDIGAAFDAINDIFRSQTFAGMNELFYFSAAQDQLIDDRELWVSDGTAGGTRLLKDIYPGVAGSFPESLFRRGSSIYFSAQDGVHGHELWRTDGTSEGTYLLLDINPGPESSQILLR